MLGKAEIENLLRDMAAGIQEARKELNHLDNEIGDGDHGTNMDRGFQMVVRRLPEIMQHDDLGQILHEVGMTLLSTIGGSAGPLYGKLFMQAGQACRGCRELDAQRLALALQAAAMGVSQTGMAVEGDKTMLDALYPACRALQKGLTEGKTPPEAVADAVAAAEAGVEYTKTIVANKGRASYLGERSLGHADPGAVSSCLLMKSLQRIL